MDNDDIRSITLRVAIFFGLTTFTLCIAIFYIESILDNTQEMVDQKDSIIVVNISKRGVIRLCSIKYWKFLVEIQILNRT